MDDIYSKTILKNNLDITLRIDLQIKDHQVNSIISSPFFTDFRENNLKKTNLNITQFLEINAVCN